MDANIGIASKDGSKARLVNAAFKNVEVCLAAYNKKTGVSWWFYKD